MNKFRILHIFPVVKFGGAPIVVLNLLKEDRENTHIVIAQYADAVLGDQFEHYAKRFYKVNVLTISIKAIWEVIRIVYVEKPDIIHSHGKGGAFYSLVASLTLLKPARIIHTFHGFNNKFSNLNSVAYLCFEKIYGVFVDRYIAVSNTEKLKVQNSKIFDEDKITVVENGVSVERQELSLDKKLILNKYDFNIVSLSRISHQKDLETMLLAFHELLKSLKDQKVGLHIIGGYIASDEEYVRRVKALCHQLELETNVVFWSDVAFAGSYLHHFDLYWSTALWEGLPTGVIEAMMQKVLVVGTDVVGNVDLIKMDTGVLTPIKAPEKIALILLERILNNNSSLIDSAFSFAHNNFSVKQYKRKVLALYDEVSL